VANRQVRRGIYGFIATVFAVGVLALGHVVTFLAIVPSSGSFWTSVRLLVFALVVALLLGTLAALSKLGAMEAEAQRSATSGRI
jgi:hypothetical protein